MPARRAALALAAASLLGGAAPAQETFQPRVFESSDGRRLGYRLHLPEAADPARRLPLVLFLHGAGERGTNNTSQLRHGASNLVAYAAAHADPAIVVVPQCPPNFRWVEVPWKDPSHTMPEAPSEPMKLVLELLDRLPSELPVDPARVYVTGISMGGFGTWDLLQRKPSLFAAGMPICGGGDLAQAPRLARVPIWAFHGDKDAAVMVSRSRDMVDAIRKAGGDPRYTEYPGVGHDSWTRTYADDKVLEWFFSRRKAD
jgi:predicted peptidase